MKLKLSFAMILAALAALFASPHPDGLERVAQQLDVTGHENTISTWFSDYHLAWMGESRASALVAGMLGVLLIAGIFTLIRWLLKHALSPTLKPPAA